VSKLLREERPVGDVVEVGLHRGGVSGESGEADGGRVGGDGLHAENDSRGGGRCLEANARVRFGACLAVCGPASVVAPAR